MNFTFDIPEGASDDQVGSLLAHAASGEFDFTSRPSIEHNPLSCSGYLEDGSSVQCDVLGYVPNLDGSLTAAVRTTLLEPEPEEYCCWVCDALATPIVHNGEVVGSNCPACSAADR